MNASHPSSARGTVCVFIAALLFSTGGLLVKLVPWSGMAINGARNLIAAVVVGIYLIVTKHRIRISPAILLGALCMAGTTTLYCLANKLTTAANTIVLQFSAPAWVVVISLLVLGKKPRKKDLLTLLAVTIGVICFFIDGLSAGQLTGNVLALLSGITYAGVFLMNSFDGSDSLSSVFLGHIIAAIIGIGFVFGETDFGSTAILGILALGIFQVAVAYILMSRGLETIPAVTACLTTAFEPILNPILVAFVFHETVTGLSLIGAVIVVLSVVIYNLLPERK